MRGKEEENEGIFKTYKTLVIKQICAFLKAGDEKNKVEDIENLLNEILSEAHKQSCQRAEHEEN